MHQQEQNLQNMHQFSSSCFSYQFLKKVIQIAISFSVFSFLFLHPSWPPFFPSFTSYLSTLSSQIFSFSSDKNYVFLLCNGILVFIAKYSRHMADTCPPPLPDTSFDHDFLYRQGLQLATENSVLVEDVAAIHEDEDESRIDINEVVQEEEEDVEEKYVIYQNTYDALKEEDYGVISNGDDDKEYMIENFDFGSYEEQQNYNKVVEDEEAEQEHEEEAIAKMSTEELNRKFDDFIRKMKEDLRIEARQQLIVV